MPPLLVVSLESAALHRGREHGAVAPRLLAYACVRRPRLRAEQVEPRSHVELGPVVAPRERNVHGRAARMARTLGNVALLEQVALVDVGIELGLAAHVGNVARPAYEMFDRAGRTIAVEYLEDLPAAAGVARNRGEHARRPAAGQATPPLVT